MNVDVAKIVIKESTVNVTYRGISSAWRASSPWISQKEPCLLLWDSLQRPEVMEAAAVLPRLTVTSPRVEVCKPQWASVTAGAL